MTIDTRLVAKGEGEPREGLVQQGNYHLALANEHRDALANAGWRPEKTDKLAQDLAFLESQVVVQSEKRGESKGATSSEAKARTEAKALIRKIRNALPIALRDNPVEGLSLASFEVGGRLAQSTPKISDYLNKIAGTIKPLDKVLQEYLGGEMASVLLLQAKKNLDSSDSTQETSRASLPQETLKIYEAKGRVLQAIEDINRLAKNAFDGEAAKSGMFNKDLLLRARQERKDNKAETPTPTK